MTSCHSAVMNKVVNSYATIKNSAVLTFIFFDNNQYKFIKYTKKNNHTMASGKDREI